MGERRKRPQLQPVTTGMSYGVFISLAFGMVMVNNLSNRTILPNFAIEVLFQCGLSLVASLFFLTCCHALNPILEQDNSGKRARSVIPKAEAPKREVDVRRLLPALLIWFELCAIANAVVHYAITLVSWQPLYYTFWQYLLASLAIYTCSALGIWLWFLIRERRSSHSHI